MDARLQQLSYSSRLTLHSCPRKYQLYKLNAAVPEDDDPTSVTFAFGHTVGAGIQEYLVSGDSNKALMAAYLTWAPDLFAENTKQVKSFWLAVAAIQRFISLCNNGFLKDWQVATFDGQPAVELGFKITLPGGFIYIGFADVVLVHKVTGEVMVLELKTTSATNVVAAMYKNSAQAIGYSIVLDAVIPGLSAYTVKYLIYKTKSFDYEVMDFGKSYLQRALWIKELLLDIERVARYAEDDIFPMHGESCNSFFRECEYFGVCTMATPLVTEPFTTELADQLSKKLNGIQISVHISDLIQAQLDKEIEE